MTELLAGTNKQKTSECVAVSQTDMYVFNYRLNCL